MAILLIVLFKYGASACVMLLVPVSTIKTSQICKKLMYF